MYSKILFIALVAVAIGRPQSSQLPADFFNAVQNLDHRPVHHQSPLNARLQLTNTGAQEEYDELQSKNAKYSFSSNIEDHISDLTQSRAEVRDGDSVKGTFSYSDGFYKITTDYIADKDGYRVLKMDAVPLDGPRVDPAGTASVTNIAHGQQLQYKVVGVPSSGPANAKI